MTKHLFAILPAIMVAASLGQLEAGLLAYYPFNTDFTDASGNNNHLTVATGTPTITGTAGELVLGGGALDIDSTISTAEYLNLTSPITFGAGDAWSIAFWARRRPGTDDRSGMVIGDPGNNVDFLWLSNNPAQVEGLRFRSSSNTNANFSGHPDDNLFHHWVVISDGAGTISAYRDNVAQTPVSATGAFSIPSVGHAYTLTTQSMDGQIDELYIYDEAIDATKVNELFTASTGGDTTPPTLAGSDIVDDQAGGPVNENTLVTYTVTFSEDMDAATVDASDFGNAGSAPASIGTVAETAPGVFSVPVTPTAPGTLQLAVLAAAVLADPAGNPLDTTNPIADDTTLTVEAGDTTAPTLAPIDIVDDQAGGPVNENTLVTYTVTFSEDMDAATVDATDFGNAGSAPASIGTVAETAPGVFSVPVTPTAPGTLQLAVLAAAVLADPAGNPLDTTNPIADDTTLTVEAGDTTAPTLAPIDIVDDQAGGPVNENTLVTYTVTFSEDMDAATVDATDFGNAGSAPASIGTVAETAPGVFSVPVTPTAPGTLQLAVLAAAILADPSGNLLDTTNPIPDDTTLPVETGPGPPPPAQRLRVYLLGGQSNADGRADPADLPTSPVNLQQPQDDVDFFYGSTLTTLRPLSQFGPEITLGRRLADGVGSQSGVRIAIIKYAVGGTSLEVDWKAGGDATTSGDGPRYVSFQTVVTNGLAALAATYPDAAIEIDGMLWVQGERDAVTGVGASYEANLTAFIADVRATYGADLPFVVSRLSSGQTSINATQLALVRDAQTAVATADPLTPLVDTDSFGMKSDALHFDALGQQQIGSASAAELLAFFPFTTPPALVLLENGDIEVTVQGAFSGFLYTLERNPTLAENDWMEVGSMTATSPLVTFTFTPPGGTLRCFFRVGRTLAP